MLRDRVFKTHNEVTMKDGRHLIVLGDKLYSETGDWVISANAYTPGLEYTGNYPRYEILTVVNPVTREVIYDNKSSLSLDKPGTELTITFNAERREYQLIFKDTVEKTASVQYVNRLEEVDLCNL